MGDFPSGGHFRGREDWCLVGWKSRCSERHILRSGVDKVRFTLETRRYWMAELYDTFWILDGHFWIPIFFAVQWTFWLGIYGAGWSARGMS